MTIIDMQDKGRIQYMCSHICRRSTNLQFYVIYQRFKYNDQDAGPKISHLGVVFLNTNRRSGNLSSPSRRCRSTCLIDDKIHICEGEVLCVAVAMRKKVYVKPTDSYLLQRGDQVISHELSHWNSLYYVSITQASLCC